MFEAVAVCLHGLFEILRHCGQSHLTWFKKELETRQKKKKEQKESAAFTSALMAASILFECVYNMCIIQCQFISFPNRIKWAEEQKCYHLVAMIIAYTITCLSCDIHQHPKMCLGVSFLVEYKMTLFKEIHL